MIKALTVKVSVEIPPSHLENIEVYINKKYSGLLLTYSDELEGVVLFYKLIGYKKEFPILPNSAGILIDTAMKFYVKTVDLNEVYELKNGLLFGIFQTNLSKTCFVKIEKIIQEEKPIPPNFECKEI